MKAYTYRKDLYYVQFHCLIESEISKGHFNSGISERVVNRLQWYWYRVQFWRFKLYMNNVLREKKIL